MRYHNVVAAAAGLLAFASTGCGPRFEVRTMAAPKVALSEFHAFHLLPTPRRSDGRPGGGAYDPMVSNSITNRALRETVADAFYNQGYVDDEWQPDFVVAVYASAREKLDPTMWQYGYPYSARWWVVVPQQTLTQYNEGTVIVDVIDPATHDLLWRGAASAALADDPAENTRLLQKVAAAIVEKFPRAKPRAVAARQ